MRGELAPFHPIVVALRTKRCAPQKLYRTNRNKCRDDLRHSQTIASNLSSDTQQKSCVTPTNNPICVRSTAMGPWLSHTALARIFLWAFFLRQQLLRRCGGGAASTSLTTASHFFVKKFKLMLHANCICGRIGAARDKMRM